MDHVVALIESGATGRSGLSRSAVRRAVPALVCAWAAASAWSVALAADTWTVIGEQGIVRYVLVPADLAADEAAYRQQITRLCIPERTCFLNFYTNRSGATPALPLPDAIANEPTATYRRSVKAGLVLFRWACRVQAAAQDCF